MVRPEGLEPPAYWFEASRSIQLSYGRTASIVTGLSDPSGFSLPFSLAIEFTRRLSGAQGILHNGLREILMTFAAVELPEAKLADFCRRHRVRELSLFGSAARGEIWH